MQGFKCENTEIRKVEQHMTSSTEYTLKNIKQETEEKQNIESVPNPKQNRALLAYLEPVSLIIIITTRGCRIQNIWAMNLIIRYIIIGYIIYIYIYIYNHLHLS